MKKLLQITAWTMTVILLSMVPLKMWRTKILADERILYIPSQTLSKSSPDKIKINVAVFLPEETKSYFSPEGDPLFSKLVQLESTDRDLVKEVSKMSGEIQVKHYWKRKTLEEQFAFGFFDRIDDFSFWNTFGVTVNAWLLFFCVSRLHRDYPSCYGDLRPLGWLLRVFFFICAASWIGFMTSTHATSEHGPLHGGPWTTRDIDGIWFTQVLDFSLFCVVGVLAGYLLAAKIKIFGAMTSTKNRRQFKHDGYCKAWALLINAGYLAFCVMAILIPATKVFPDHVIALDLPRYVGIVFAYQIPLLLVTAWAWFKTRDTVSYSMVRIPWFFWISTKPK